MPITAGDLSARLSGGAGNSNPNLSLGGAMSTTAWAGGVLHDLFDPVSGDENAAEEAEYRCIYVLNSHATLTWTDVKAWLEAIVAGGAEIAIGLGAAEDAAASAQPVAATIANEDTAPAGGVAFAAPTTKAGGLSLGDVGPTRGFPIWIRRTTTDSGALNNDGARLEVEGDTAE